MRRRPSAVAPSSLAHADRRCIGDVLELLIGVLDQAGADDGCGALLDPSHGQRRWFAA